MHTRHTVSTVSTSLTCVLSRAFFVSRSSSLCPVRWHGPDAFLCCPAVPAGSGVVDPQPSWFCFGTLVPTWEGQGGRGVFSTDVAFATPRLEATELEGCEVSERDFSPDFVCASAGEMATELLLFQLFSNVL